jgi:hypothetical protein|tara:strand:+ start:320 stop:502 length:183 start_codon:yes stop_codon:yes gene_type:complete
MDKFTSQVQIEDTADFQVWLDAQEVADIRAMEVEALARARAAARAYIQRFDGTLKPLARR